MFGESLFQQFVVTDRPWETPANWGKKQLGDVSIFSAPYLPVIDVVDAQGRTVGICLGWVTFQGALYEDGDILALPTVGTGEASWLDNAGGRFVAIQANADGLWFHVDAAASLAAVVSPRHRMIASTTALIPPGYGTEDDSELISHFHPRRSDTCFPLDLTRRRHISRILPNHAVNLSNFSLHRVWPTSLISYGNEKDILLIDDNIEFICRNLKANIGAFAARHLIHAQLSGGQDTRMVLAASRDHLDQIRFWTLRTPEKSMHLDCLLSTALAERFGLRHEIVDFVEPDPHDLERWMLQTGECVGGRVWKMATTVKRLTTHECWISGQFAEVGRAFYWQQKDLVKYPLCVGEILARAHIPACAKTTKALEQWIDKLPKGPPTWIFDIFYIEHRLGAGMGPSYYGSLIPRINVSPFNQRSIFKAMLQLPLAYRYHQHMSRDIIKRLWPELLEIPINRAFGMYRLRFWEAEVKSTKRFMPEGIRHIAKKLYSWMRPSI
jgi:hypothetical protein